MHQPGLTLSDADIDALFLRDAAPAAGAPPEAPAAPEAPLGPAAEPADADPAGTGRRAFAAT
ncbi:MAG: hypothetical protein ACYDD1_06345 [Caulobacteraceae bacterium]